MRKRKNIVMNGNVYVVKHNNSSINMVRNIAHM
jgi:hypothetical protein